MREMIREAARTIEDSQTAQALHGLLTLNSDSGSGNIPALLGQHTPSHGQVPSAAAGSAEVSHTVEVSTEPLPAASSTEASHPGPVAITSIRAPAVTNTVPQSSASAPQQQVTYDTKAMDLLQTLQAQSATVLQSGGGTMQQQQQQSSSSSLESPRILIGNSTGGTSVKPVQTLSSPAFKGTLLPQTQTSQAQQFSLGVSPSVAPLLQLLQQSQNTQLPAATGSQIPTVQSVSQLAAILQLQQAIKGQGNTPVQVIAAPGGQAVKKEEQPPPPPTPLFVSSGVKINNPAVSHGLVVSPLVTSPPVSASTPMTTEHNKSPLKKRPYPITPT